MDKTVYFVTFLVVFFRIFSMAKGNEQAFEAAVNELTNVCMDAKYHKSVPGPEDSLHSQCFPWVNRSCCKVGTSVSIHTEYMYNFDWNHCSHVLTLSSKCRRHILQDLCFYECSPNVGPWLVEVKQKIRNQRFVNVPLCRTDCEAWFQDCIDDYTCTDNWGRNFDWQNGRNKCPTASKCMTFKNIYKNNASYFCETIWDHSWKVVENTDHCMRLWFNSEHGNPNDAVARWKAEEIVGAKMKKNHSEIASLDVTMFLIILLNLWFVASNNL